MTSVKLFLGSVWDNVFAPFPSEIYGKITTDDVSVVPMNCNHNQHLSQIDNTDDTNKEDCQEVYIKDKSSDYSNFNDYYENSEVCNFCFKPLSLDNYARMPCTYGGWTGYYCSWKCVAKSNYDSGYHEYERFLIIAFLENKYQELKRKGDKKPLQLYNMGLYPHMELDLIKTNKYKKLLEKFLDKYKLRDLCATKSNKVISSESHELRDLYTKNSNKVISSESHESPQEFKNNLRRRKNVNNTNGEVKHLIDGKEGKESKESKEGKVGSLIKFFRSLGF